MNKKLFLGFILVALLTSGTFYWYEWRPKSIKQECLVAQQDKEKEMRDKITNIRMEKDFSMTTAEFKLVEDTINTKSEKSYKQCLIEKGL